MLTASPTATDASTWPPPLYPVRHGINAPLGAVRIARQKRVCVRMIKIRMDGNPGRRWVRLARWWWERNMGLVPEGMRVIHEDGDTLNDDPHNYTLATAGDVIALAHLTNPKWSEKQHRKAAAACAEFNRDRAAMNRLANWLPTRWYAVDLDGHRIINEPHRQCWQVYAAHGCAVGPHNWRRMEAVVLGYAGVTAMQAGVLVSLQSGPHRTSRIWDAVLASYRRQRWVEPQSIASLYSAICDLRRAGLLMSERRGLHALTDAGRQLDYRPCPVTAVRGSDLVAGEFAGLARTIASKVPEAIAA